MLTLVALRILFRLCTNITKTYIRVVNGFGTGAERIRKKDTHKATLGDKEDFLFPRISYIFGLAWLESGDKEEIRVERKKEKHAGGSEKLLA